MDWILYRLQIKGCAQQFLNGRPEARIIVETSSEHIDDGFWDLHCWNLRTMLRELNRSLPLVARSDFGDIQAVERCCAIYHLVQNATERPNVRGSTELDASFFDAEGFGRNIIQTSLNLGRIAEDVGMFVRQLFRDPKVDELQYTIDIQEIGGLEIAMNHTSIVCSLDGLQDLLPIHPDLVEIVTHLICMITYRGSKPGR